MKHKCARIQNELSAYLDKEKTDIPVHEIKAHIDTCDECRKIYQNLQSASEFVNNAPLLMPKSSGELRKKFFPVMAFVALCCAVLAWYMTVFRIPVIPEPDHSVASAERKAVITNEPDKKVIKQAITDFKSKAAIPPPRARSVAPAFSESDFSAQKEIADEFSEEIILSAKKSDENPDDLILYCENSEAVKNEIYMKLSRVFTVIRERNSITVQCRKEDFLRIVNIKEFSTGNRKLIVKFRP